MKEVEVSKLELLKMETEQHTWYNELLFEYRKYLAVHEQDHDLVSKVEVQLCHRCHRSLFNQRESAKCCQLLLLVSSILVIVVTSQS